MKARWRLPVMLLAVTALFWLLLDAREVRQAVGEGAPSRRRESPREAAPSRRNGGLAGERPLAARPPPGCGYRSPGRCGCIGYTKDPPSRSRRNRFPSRRRRANWRALGTLAWRSGFR